MKQILYRNGKKIVDGCDIREIKGKTVLITGASGLFGVHFLYSIVSLNEEDFPAKVYAVHYSELPPYLQELKRFPFIQFIQGDLSEDDFCQSLPKADFIIHGAGYGQPGKFMKNQIKAFRMNTLATLSLLNKLAKNGRFLFLSSCAVYTGGGRDLYKEEDIGMVNTNHPRICYIEGKRAGEAICNIYRKEMGVSAASVRISFTYGPGVRSGDVRAMYEFIEKASGGNICLRDKGEAFHTYCYITDAMVMAWNVLLRGTQDVYNIAGTESVTIYQLARTIADLMDATVTVPEEGCGVAGAHMSEIIDISRVQNEFGRNTFVTLRDGLKETIAWYTAQI